MEKRFKEPIVKAELPSPCGRVEKASAFSGRGQPSSEPKTGLSASVEAHLTTYFKALEDDLPDTGLYARILQEVEEPLLRMVLDLCNGNQLRAAAVLGLNRNTLRKKIRACGLMPEKAAQKRKRGT
ncbi:MAG: helix-turn-helix domain-containing protein [Bdellovibrionales bacterium]